LLAERDENIYSPIVIDKDKNNNLYYLMKHYYSFFQKIFQPDKIGLSIDIDEDEPKRGLHVQEKLKRFIITFVRPYPLYVYMQLSEAAATGEWEERR
jgi:hypothetical protein